MTDDRGTGRPEPARDLAEENFDTFDDPDATRPIARPPQQSAAWGGSAAQSDDQRTEPVSALDRPRRLNTESQWFWPLTNLLGIVVVILVNWAANAIPFNDQSTGDVINKDPIWFQPAGWAFAIWGLIYALLLAFAVYGLLPAGRANGWVRRISPLFLVANIANIVWLFCWHWEYFPASLVAILVLLAALALIVGILHWRRKGDREASKGERYLVWPVFSIYLGWVSVASCANFSLLQDRQGWSGGPFSLQWWAVILLAIAVAASAFFGVFRRDGWYPLVVGFASFAIAAEQWDRSRLVSVAAGIAGVAALALAVIGVLMAFDRRAMMGMYSTKRGQDEPVPSE